MRQQEAAPPVVRNLRFNLEHDKIPRYWHGGRRAVTLFFNNLSIFFPAGERFFIASVHAHRQHVRDPRLADAVQAFCGQEGVHSREHVRYNELLAAQGYPIAALERRVTRLLRRVAKVLPVRRQLAVTCALEHFTATLAHLVLKDARLLAGADPNLAALWRWHAAEESEHRAVAFDVYRAAGGRYSERAFVMGMVTLIFWGRVIGQQIRLMNSDGLLWNLREWAALGRFLFVEPGGMLRLFWLYLPYFRPGFHPLDLDSEELVAAWQRDLATAPPAPAATAGAPPA